VQDIQADDPTIDVSPGDDPLSTQSIKRRVEVTKGMRTLGVVRLAPDGNDYDEYKHRMEEATMMRPVTASRQLHSTESMLPSDSALSGR
jgi:hypothetical protein